MRQQTIENGDLVATIGLFFWEKAVFVISSAIYLYIRAWYAVWEDRGSIEYTEDNKLNTTVENTITKVFSKADQFALLDGKVEKELGSTDIKLSEAQVKKLLEGLKDGKSVDDMVAELKNLCESGNALWDMPEGGAFINGREYENAIQSTTAVPGKAIDTFVYETAELKVIVNSTGKVITVYPK